MSNRRRDLDDEDFDDDFEHEDDVDTYGDDEDSVELLPCPHCGAAIYEEAQQCPKCGEYVETAAIYAARKPLWIVLTLMLLIAMFVFFALQGF